MNLQSPIDGVLHRSEYPGGEQAYLNSIPQNLFLAEVPIDTSVSLQSGIYKNLTAELNYSFISASVRGDNISNTEGEVICDDCVGEVSRVTIKDQILKEKYEFTPCVADGVFKTGNSFSKSLTFQSTETNLENFDIACPTGAISPEEIIELLQSNGVKESFVLGMRLDPTGYASKPFYHDYIIGLDRPKGLGAKVSFKIGDFTYSCEYRSEFNSLSNGFIGPTVCVLELSNETFTSFKVTLSP